METTNGAEGQCIFSDGVVINERISESIPRERLTFEDVEQSHHPESYGHFSLHRGPFVLRDNHDGTTMLIGTSWYTLHVRPLWHFDLWTHDMTREAHLRGCIPPVLKPDPLPARARPGGGATNSG